MTSPGRIEKGSLDIASRASIRFYKDLSNYCVVVVEKEQKTAHNVMKINNVG